MKKLNIAVDGPSGAGKSSLARALAHEMGLIYVDTGALYRTIGLFMTENNIDVHDGPAVAARHGDIHLELTYQGGTPPVSHVSRLLHLTACPIRQSRHMREHWASLRVPRATACAAGTYRQGRSAGHVSTAGNTTGATSRCTRI